MTSSIPEIAKYINRKLSLYDCIALGVCALGSALFGTFLYQKQKEAKLPVVYRASTEQVLGATSEARPFGSKNGTTYTYSWCQGSSQIKEANKIFFTSSVAAENAGRRLSKLCQK